MRIFDDASMFVRFALGLKSYLQPVTIDDCGELLLERARRREDSFLHFLEHGVFSYPRSPYRALLRWAGLDLGGVSKLI
jgi:hypothetical protein